MASILSDNSDPHQQNNLPHLQQQNNNNSSSIPYATVLEEGPHILQAYPQQHHLQPPTPEAQAVEDHYWKDVPQELWDKVVMKDGIPGLHDGNAISKIVGQCLNNEPRIHKYVDVTREGFKRFFEALDTNVDGVLSLDELHEGFQRTLNDFGLWEEESAAFRAYWEATWVELVEGLRKVVLEDKEREKEKGMAAQTTASAATAPAQGTRRSSSSLRLSEAAAAAKAGTGESKQQQHEGGEGQEGADVVGSFSYDAFAGLLRRLKLELAMRVWETPGSTIIFPSTAPVAAVGGERGSGRGGGGGGEEGAGGVPFLPPALQAIKSMIRIDMTGVGGAGGFGAGTPKGRRRSIQLEEEEVVLKTYTWNARHVHGMDVTRRHMRDFFLCHRDPQWTMRWIIADSTDRANIIRLSIKYRFHPLHLEDVLKLDRQQPRSLKYGGHYFIILPVLRLIQNDAKAAGGGMNEGEEKDKDGTTTTMRGTTTTTTSSSSSSSRVLESIRIEKSRIAIFAAGPPNFDTIISIHGAWRRVRNRCCIRSKEETAQDQRSSPKSGMELLAVEGASHDTFLTPSIMPHKQLPTPTRQDSAENIILSAMDEDRSHTDAPNSVLAAAANLLQEDYSSVRQGNSNWMLHAMIDSVGKMLVPIVAAYDKRLRYYQKELEGPDAIRMRERLSKPIMDVKHDLIWLQKRVKSIKPVLRSIISEPRLQADDVVFYIQGVDDDLEILFDDVNTMLVLIQGLLDEAKYMKDDTRNEALKLFAVMTTTFCPLQFMAGR
jgi:Mg2+ and Co2+ transporter CorA